MDSAIDVTRGTLEFLSTWLQTPALSERSMCGACPRTTKQLAENRRMRGGEAGLGEGEKKVNVKSDFTKG